MGIYRDEGGGRETRGGVRWEVDPREACQMPMDGMHDRGEGAITEEETAPRCKGELTFLREAKGELMGNLCVILPFFLLITRAIGLLLTTDSRETLASLFIIRPYIIFFSFLFPSLRC
jgi:hypothetical protein